MLVLTKCLEFLNGLGIAIVSTSHGVMTGKQAERENVGGEAIMLRILKTGRYV
jgi:small subunit ribosomal protein S8